MHAVVYHGPGSKSWEEVPDPQIVSHHFTFDQFMEAYEVFSQSARPGALKVALTPDAAG